MNTKPKIGFVPASRGFFNQNLAAKARAETIKSMKAAGITPVLPSKDMTPRGLVESFDDARKAAILFRHAPVDGVIIGAVNFGNEIPAAVAAIDGAAGLPIMLFGCTEEGKLTRGSDRRDALCGALSIATALRQRQAKYTFPKIANCSPADPAFIEELKDFAAVCRAVSGVRGSVYGQIGTRPAEFETCAFDEMSLLRKFGIRTVPTPLSEVFERAKGIENKGKITRTVKSIKSMFDTNGVPDISIERMARLEIVLKEIIEENKLNGLALQCWTSMQEDYGISACAVMARINQMLGIPAACEVDIHGTLSMHMLSLAAGGPAVLMDWNNRHYKLKNVFSAWHCGVFPPALCGGKCKLAANAIMTGVMGSPDRVYGVLDGALDTGPVTMTRLTETPDGEWKLLVAEGESVQAPGEPPGGNGWVRIADLDRLYRALLRDFPHHGALAMGHSGRLLATAAHFLGLDVVAPLPIKNCEL